MEPAIQDGSHYFVNRLYYKFNSYAAGDIVIFWHQDRVWVSRIIGLENQELHISDNVIMVDNLVYNDNVKRDWSNGEYVGNMVLMA